MKVRAEYFAIALLGLLSVAGGSLATARQAALSADEPVRSNPEQTLWDEIRQLARPEPSTQPARVDFDGLLARRRTLLGRLQHYGAIYPGGAHRAEAFELELVTLYEIGCLSGGEFDEFRRRVASGIQHPPCAGAEHEAAYWVMLLDGDERADRRQRSPASRPTSEPSSSAVTSPQSAVADAEWLESLAAYVQRHPSSRYSVSFRERLFERAAARGDIEAMTRTVAELKKSFAAHPITARLNGRLQRQKTVGKPFWLNFAEVDDATFDTRQQLGSPVAIVIWDSAEPACAKRIREVEAYRRRHHEMIVVGVNLDQRRTDMTAAADEFEIRWPQFNDGRGPANEFAAAWGVSRLPLVFLIDRRGRLMGWSEDDAWKALADKALEN